MNCTPKAGHWSNFWGRSRCGVFAVRLMGIRPISGLCLPSGDAQGNNLKQNANGLIYQPRLRAVVTCDYTGFVAPEMVKIRSVVVLSKSKTNDRLITVVPLSTTPPARVLPCHHKLDRNPHPDESPALEVWAKCDMVYTVSLSRVNYYKTKPRRGGRATYHSTLTVSPGDFLAIQRGARYALGLDALPESVPAVVAS
ncbi:MAG: type II toxin-antitoxin system PemK/MazF family toxin [Trinickia sp.]|uniref:type II toxin-antitoxin system PemK/MazF family toxin n=1 Tax=Trinickia sp. TaxID=2571163 RepID=UPI003F7D20F8